MPAQWANRTPIRIAEKAGVDDRKGFFFFYPNQGALICHYNIDDN